MSFWHYFVLKHHENSLGTVFHISFVKIEKLKTYTIMTLVRYNPLTNFVPSTFGDFIENAIRENDDYAFSPNADIIKNEKSIELLVTLPGVNKKDITLDLDENRLTIKGERKASENAEFIKRENNYGSFERSFKLNDEIETSNINAVYNDGILKVTLPIVEKAPKTTIKVK